jgi:ADP-heptose:LPS heptosyltransferase
LDRAIGKTDAVAMAPLETFLERTRAAKKIVVVDLGFLGDTLHLVPAMWEIKRNYPGAELHAVSTPVGAAVLRLAPCVDRAWPLVIDPAKRTLREQWRLVRALRREKFDLVINFAATDRAGFLAALTGAKWRVAQTGGHPHFWDHWIVKDWAPKQDRNTTVFEQRRGMLAACGFKLEPPRFELRVDEESEKWAAKAVTAGAFHLSINSNNPLKEWPLEHCAAMLQAVWRALPEVRVIATAANKERERARVKRLIELTKDERLQPLAEEPGIAQLAGLLRRCKLHIGPDSGVMHLAAALEVPTLSFFREQGDFKSWMPTGPQHKVLSSPCKCIDHYSAPCQPSELAECLTRIQPAQVAELICSQLQAAEPFRHWGNSGKSTTAAAALVK